MLIIDRFEGDYVILEDDKNHYEIKKSELPCGCREGDVIESKGGVYTINTEQTELRREAIKRLQRSLWD
jgi:hypothetical protein